MWFVLASTGFEGRASRLEYSSWLPGLDIDVNSKCDLEFAAAVWLGESALKHVNLRDPNDRHKQLALEQIGCTYGHTHPVLFQ